MNRVLHRPMFRREALRKGYIKPIRAKVGIYQGPMQMQGPPVNTAPYSKVPLQFQGPTGQYFSYDPKSGQYLTGYGKSKIKSGSGKIAKGLTGISALYAGAEMAGVPDPLIQAAGMAEIASLPFAFAKKPTTRMIGQILGAGSRFAASNPLGAIGIGGALAVGGGTKAYFDERKLVEDYARANNIPVKKAMDIFNRDMVGKGGRPISEFRKSDLGKAVVAASSARNILAGGLDKSPEGPPGTPSAEQRIAKEMRNYFDDSKKFGRYYQDVDELVQKVKDKQKAANLVYEDVMGPDDEMQVDSIGKRANFEVLKASVELRNAIAAQNNLDPFKATNIAQAIVNGEMKLNEVNEAATSDDFYAKLSNDANDPNHPNAKKDDKAKQNIEKDNNKKDPNLKDNGISTKDATGTQSNDQDNTGDPQIDIIKNQYAGIDMAQFLKANPRDTEMNPQRVFLLKLAAGLMSGKSMQGGFAGLADVFGQALGPALDSKILVKMKNDEAYRDWASTVLSYNTELIKARNDILNADPQKRQLGSISMDGNFFEAYQDKDTQQIFVFDPKTGASREVSTLDATFYPEKDSSQYIDNIRLVADGAMAAKILQDQIALMNTPQGKTAIGASGLILSFAETIGNLPGEIKEGIVGSISSTFDQTVPEDENYINSKGKNKGSFQENTDKILGKFEGEMEDYLKKNASASETLGKLKVNARMLTYTLANALKDKDRLTNRDLQLIEELTGTLSTEPDAKIIQKYEELLRRVQQKNNVRLTKFYTMGQTPNDVRRILEPIEGQLIDQVQPEILTMEDAFKAFGIQ